MKRHSASSFDVPAPSQPDISNATAIAQAIAGAGPFRGRAYDLRRCVGPSLVEECRGSAASTSRTAAMLLRRCQPGFDGSSAFRSSRPRRHVFEAQICPVAAGCFNPLSSCLVVSVSNDVHSDDVAPPVSYRRR